MKVYQTSDWDYRWEFGGGGSIPFEIRFGPVRTAAGRLEQNFQHQKHGSGSWVLDEETLRPLAFEEAGGSADPRPSPTDPEMQRRTATDLGRSDRPGARYVLEWQTWPSNRDRPRPRPWPEPSLLRLREIEPKNGS